MSAIEIGTVIDEVYRVDGVIGRGGFGVVYRCEDLTLQRPVALKMLDPDRAGERELRRFLAEGRNLASLNHPNVVQIYRFGTEEGQPYLVMELVRGKPLRELLRQGSLPMRRTLDCVALPGGLRCPYEHAPTHHAACRTGVTHGRGP